MANNINVEKTLAEKYFKRARLKYEKDPKFTTQLNDLNALLDKGLYIDFFTKFNTSLGQLDAEEAQHHFNNSPLARYAGTKDGLICSYIKTGTTIKRRENELGKGTFGRVKKTTTGQDPIPASFALKRVKLEPDETLRHKIKNFSPYKKESLFNQLMSDAKNDLSQREQALQTNHQLTAEIKQLKNEKKRLNDWEKSKNYEAVINTYYTLFKFKKEATINYDLNIALSDLVIRRNENSAPYKAYLDMHYYKHSLPEAITLIAAEDDSTRENYTIDALLSLMELHNGEASLSQKHYALLDIKPDNIRVDDKGKIHFIDFGFAKRNELEREFTASSGTPIYMPKNYDKHATYKYINLLTSFKSLEPLKVTEAKNAEKNILQSISNYRFHPTQKTPNPLINDIIALLRVIWHPWSVIENKRMIKDKIYSIYTYEAFKRLPVSIQDILDTSDIDRCINFFSKAKHPLQFLASVFSLHQQDPKACTKEKIEQLLTSPQEQERLIKPHLKLKNKKNSILDQCAGVNGTAIQLGESPLDEKDLKKAVVEADSMVLYESLSKNSFLNANKIQTSSSTSRLLTSKEDKDRAIKHQIFNFNLAVEQHECAEEKNKNDRLADIKRAFASLCKIVSQRRNRLFSTPLPRCLFSMPESEKQLIDYLMMEGQAKLKKLLNLPDEKEKLILRIEEDESMNPTPQ